MANAKEDAASRKMRSLPTTGAGSENKSSSDTPRARKRKREDEYQVTPSTASVGRTGKRQCHVDNLRKQVLRKSANSHSIHTPFRTPLETPLRRGNGSRCAFLDVSLPAFKYQESDIEIIEIIGSTPHYVIFRIMAGGQFYHLYMYKYDFNSMLPHGLPGRNTFFENARVAYGQVNLLRRKIANVPVPQYYGDVNFSRLPQKSRTTRVSSARPCLPYSDFLYRGAQNVNDAKRERAWKRYFENKSRSICVLQGLVLEEIIEWEPFADSKFWSRDLEAWLVPPDSPAPSVIAKSIQESLELVHSVGIQYGSAFDWDSIWLQEIGESGELKIFLTDFSLAEVGDPGSRKLQWKQARELKWWRQQAMLSTGQFWV